MFGFTKKVLVAIIIAALPSLKGDREKIARWAGLLAGWAMPNSGTATTITAPTTGTASNVARRAWKNQNAEKGTVAITLGEWTTAGFMLKASSGPANQDAMRVAITQAIPKIMAVLPDTDGDPRIAVSNDPNGDGVIVTAYWLERGDVRPGG